MSEHQDPIRRLETFDSGGSAMTPIAPSEVRRLGDRRRARRRAAYVAAAAVAVAIAVVPLALLDGGDDAAPPITHHSGGPTPALPTASPSASGSATPPQVITYPGSGVTVVTAADSEKLTGTSDDFRTFVGGLAQKAAADGASCPGAFHGVTVHKYSSAGYAIGGFNACGGYAALWTRYHGTWGEGQATQDVWDCDALAFLQVPASFAGDCADEAGDFGLQASGGPRPGMTRTQAEAVGIRVTGDAAAPPCVSTQYASPVVPGDDTRGLFSPHDGLVQVAMTSAMKTAEKVGLGTPRDTVLAAYPKGSAAADNLWLVDRPGGTAFLILFDADGRVMRFTWQLNTADCADYMR
jgi:hypothetical protein